MATSKKMHKTKERRKPCFLLFWKKTPEPTKTLCGRSVEEVFHSPDRMAITCKSCRKIMNAVD